MTKQEDKQMEKCARYVIKILENPTGIAVALYRTFTAYMNAGFSEPQAIELTKHTMAMIIGMGASLDESQ